MHRNNEIDLIKENAYKCFFCENIDVEFGLNKSVLVVNLNDFNEAITIFQIKDFVKLTKDIVAFYDNSNCAIKVTNNGLNLRFSLII